MKERRSLAAVGVLEILGVDLRNLEQRVLEGMN